MPTSLRRLINPALITIAGLIMAHLPFGPTTAFKMVGLSLATLAGTLMALRLLDMVVWHGWMVRDGRSAPPRLLTDLFAAVVMIITIMILAGSLFGAPVTGLVTTSGVLVAVVGFALRDMLASLFSGIALNIEHPFGIGDWIGLDTGEVGQVIEVSWLTTQLRTNDRVIIVIPNAELATRRFKNYGAAGDVFRSEIEVTIDHAVATDRVERVLLNAVRSVSDANRTTRAPDLKIKEFSERGIVWQIRFWIDDYFKLVEIRYGVQRAVLRHLHQAGIALPYSQHDVFQASMPERHLDLSQHREQVIARVDLFRNLQGGDLTALAQATIERQINVNTILTEEGDHTRSLYIVLEGNLRVTVKGEGQERLTVNQLAAGAFFGEYSLLTGAPRSARVEALSDCVLLEITSDALTPILQRCDGLADHLARVLAARQSMTQEARTETGGAKPGGQEEGQLLTKIRALFGL